MPVRMPGPDHQRRAPVELLAHALEDRQQRRDHARDDHVLHLAGRRPAWGRGSRARAPARRRSARGASRCASAGEPGRAGLVPTPSKRPSEMLVLPMSITSSVGQAGSFSRVTSPATTRAPPSCAPSAQRTVGVHAERDALADLAAEPGDAHAAPAHAEARPRRRAARRRSRAPRRRRAPARVARRGARANAARSTGRPKLREAGGARAELLRAAPRG